MKLNQVKYYLIPSFWIVVTFLMIGQDLLSSTLRDTTFVWSDSLIFKVKWLLYIPITFFVFWLGEKLPLQPPQLFKKLFYHLLISFCVSIIAIFIYSFIVNTLWHAFIGGRGISFSIILIKNLAVSLFNEFVNYWLILGSHKAYTILRQFQQNKLEKSRLEKQLSEAKLGFLKMQLQPHFLFNTHHTIIGLMQRGDMEKATQMLIKLSDLLRLSLKENNQDLVHLRNELQLLQLYLAILKIRFEEKLDYSVDIDYKLQEYYVPPMLLQPVVENAIKYGIEPFAKKGMIEIKAEKRGEKLCLSVSDNGIENQSPINFNFGIGLSNIQERLKSLFEEDYELQVTQNSHENGITVKIIIPIIQ